MAAAYALMVPLMEFPSGILADRWSRRGVLIIASLALTGTALIGGLSTGVGLYIVSALVLGVYFAMYSGTMDAAVYDTILEETGNSEQFERFLGRIRMVNSVALVASSLSGGVLATWTSTRTTYLVTVPFAALSIVALLKFREPLLHKSGGESSLRTHLALTLNTITRQRHLDLGGIPADRVGLRLPHPRPRRQHRWLDHRCAGRRDGPCESFWSPWTPKRLTRE